VWTEGFDTPDHSGGLQCTMAGASVHTIPYEINAEVFRRLGVRNDGAASLGPLTLRFSGQL
jgi:hypothetical protein